MEMNFFYRISISEMVYLWNSQLTKAKCWQKERWRHLRYMTHIAVLRVSVKLCLRNGRTDEVSVRSSVRSFVPLFVRCVCQRRPYYVVNKLGTCESFFFRSNRISNRIGRIYHAGRNTAWRTAGVQYRPIICWRLALWTNESDVRNWWILVHFN